MKDHSTEILKGIIADLLKAPKGKPEGEEKPAAEIAILEQKGDEPALELEGEDKPEETAGEMQMEAPKRDPFAEEEGDDAPISEEARKLLIAKLGKK